VSKFLSDLCLENADPTDDGQWIVTAPLIYQSDVANRIIVVPAGFKTDLASVPRLPVVFLLTGDTSREAACVHDFLYSTHIVDREMADAVLREASAVTGVPAWRRGLMWAGVRLFGGAHWNPTEAVPS
jgi:hypothetical protein